MTPAQPGDLLADRYRLRSVIGRGGMGVVWAAEDQLLARGVAIKETLWPADLDEQERTSIRERVLREARIAARLSHPGIVSMYDVVEHDQRPWLVMQLVPYPSLREVVAGTGPLRPARAAEAGLKILAAVRAAHRAGVLHRDIKPANVLLGPDDEVYLTDFGLAVRAGHPTMTSAGLVLGSPAYMAPERARGEPATAATDMWALGATLYACVEGRDPFARRDTIAVLTAIVADQPDAPARAGPLWPAIGGLLRKDPEERLDGRGAEEMLRSVRDLCAGEREAEQTGLLTTAPGSLVPALCAVPAATRPAPLVQAAQVTVAAEPLAADPVAADPVAPGDRRPGAVRLTATTRRRRRGPLMRLVACLTAAAAVVFAAEIVRAGQAGGNGRAPEVTSTGSVSRSGTAARHPHRGSGALPPARAVSAEQGNRPGNAASGRATAPVPGPSRSPAPPSPTGSPSPPTSPSPPPSPSPTQPSPSPSQPSPSPTKPSPSSSPSSSPRPSSAASASPSPSASSSPPSSSPASAL